MARNKETIAQKDFSLGAIHPNAEERDDEAFVGASLREAKNTLSTTTGQCEVRPGLCYDSTVTGSDPFEVDLGAGRQYEFLPTPTGYQVFNADGSVVVEDTGMDWTALSGVYGSPSFSDLTFWVVADPDSSSIIIGAQQLPPQVLQVDDAGIWTFGAFAFDQGLGGTIYQPYFNYYSGISIQPSALTGSINITASSGIWTSDHEGLVIRYGGREIQLDTLTSSTVMAATVIEELPPTFDLTVASVSGYRIGDAVEHDTLGGQGIITNISGSVITVFVTAGFDGFTNSGKLIAPDAQATITNKANGTPASVALWDIQMLSPVHGFPGYAARHKNRLYFCDFIHAPLAFASSTAGLIDNFRLGPDDADGFVEIIGSGRGGSLLYMISAEDLLFLTTRGVYYQQTRDGNPVTPTTIAPIPFSKMGCASVRPVSVDDGVVFVDSVGEQVYGAVLTGDVYRSWTVIPLTKYHSHLIDGPTYIGATSFGTERPEQFIYVVNAGGAAAVCQWDRDAGRVSWRPWETEGEFVAIYQSLGRSRAIVGRVINGAEVTFRERFEYGCYVDAMAAVKVSSAHLEGEEGQPYLNGTTSYATHLGGHTASVYFENWDYGDLAINVSGRPLAEGGSVFDYNDYDGYAQVGLNFEVLIGPWSRRSVRTQRGERDVKREIEIYVTVKDTGLFSINGEEFGGYRVSEDASVPPPLRNDEYRTAIPGGDAFERNEIKRERPGPFMVSQIKYRVTV